jgi:hypothetical protein
MIRPDESRAERRRVNVNGEQRDECAMTSMIAHSARS